MSKAFWYSGSLSSKKRSDTVRTAYQSWLDQRQRCNNKKNPSYPYYGGRGIKVVYSSREFVGWWISQKFTGKKPTISRIDHGGNYEFSNVRLEEHIENCVLDTIKRHGPPSLKCRRPLAIYSGKTGKLIKIARDGKEAEKITGILRTNICKYAKGKLIRKNKDFLIKYLGEESATA